MSSQVQVEEAARAMEEDDVVLVDVRNPDEYAQSHARGAVNIPLDELEERRGELPSDPAPMVICGTGGRSDMAATMLRGHDLDVVDVEGGTEAWQAAGLPVERGADG